MLVRSDEISREALSSDLAVVYGTGNRLPARPVLCRHVGERGETGFAQSLNHAALKQCERLFHWRCPLDCSNAMQRQRANMATPDTSQ